MPELIAPLYAPILKSQWYCMCMKLDRFDSKKAAQEKVAARENPQRRAEYFSTNGS